MKLSKKTVSTAIALSFGAALTLGSTAAMAVAGNGDGHGKMGHKGGFMKMEFVEVDVDQNGQITVEDLQAAAQARFVAADADGDGALTLDEMKAQAEKRMAEKGVDGDKRSGKRGGDRLEKMLSHKDKDGNGSLSMDEAMPDQSKLERMISRFDTDGDNAVSAEEFEAAQKKMSERRGKHGGKDCDRKG